MAEPLKRPTPTAKVAPKEAPNAPAAPAAPAEPKAAASAAAPSQGNFVSDRANFDQMSAIEHAEFVIKTVLSVPVATLNMARDSFKRLTNQI
ncbi:hypothetical protein Ctha_0044 [Chloroherpeton thalassium ATCC 35110]|uniref:Uncharacterized protein n=1 Tax=Chloroherpeton thalassium (strain ATCC 35110 / GB-78) TaxID=517418 RepID=B3QSC5_CHLT3|nr:hypothetical protein [Chloroherpeton thalassium]ACF12516.1 hypothetical protein Ctha_0044 [Chloroherpeton thalassium ATCC 35110]